MNLDKKRWLILWAGFLANLCQGAAYASSIFAKPIMEYFKCEKPQAALAFSLIIACLPIGAIAGGKMADQRGPKTVVTIGSIIFSLGILLAGFSKTLPMLYVTYGVMMGIGSGMAYGAIVGASVKWFPDKRGLASGLVVGALGGGPLVLSIPAQTMLSKIGLMSTFQVFGIVFLVVMVAASRFVEAPPKDYVPAGYIKKETAQASAPAVNMTWTQMIARPWFWMIYVLYALGSFAGLMLISQAMPIAAELTKLDKMNAAAVVGYLALANALGRLVWGAVSDKIGRTNSLVLMFLFTSLIMFAMTSMAGSMGTLIAAFAIAGLCYGGYLGIFPSMCADAFGTLNMTVNYGVLFSAFAIAGVTGPIIGSKIAAGSGGYPQAFVVAGAVAAAGFVIAIIAKLSEKTLQPKEA